MTDTEAYAAPTPSVLYIHDDLSEYVGRRQGGGISGMATHTGALRAPAP